MSKIQKLREICVENPEDEKDFNATLEHVGKYGLTYEVFDMAFDKLPENPTKQEAIDAICMQMLDWDVL